MKCSNSSTFYNCPNCPPIRQTPIWPGLQQTKKQTFAKYYSEKDQNNIGNSPNELLYYNQRLFSRDNHNHDQVLGEKTFNLPLLTPENQKREPFQYCNAYSGETNIAPFSTENLQHQNWVPFRVESNVNTPIGSDSNIYFDKVAPAETFTKFLDWLDVNGKEKNKTCTKNNMDENVAACCEENGGMVCSMTCVDWWTNRPVPQQGLLTQSDGSGGGCPFNTLRALSCYPCKTHNTYVNGKLYK